MGRRCRRDEGADPALGLDEAFVVELAVRLEHRVRVDGQALDDLLDRRQPVAGSQDPEADRLPHLLHELEIGRDAGSGLEMELNHDLSSRIDKESTASISRVKGTTSQRPTRQEATWQDGDMAEGGIRLGG